MEWAKRLESNTDVRTIADLLQRYSIEVVPGKKASTRAHNAVAIKRLVAICGHNPISGLTPQQVYKYIDARESKIAARREVEVLSHAYTKAVEWGYLDRPPFKGEVRLKGEKSRDRYIEDWEVVEFLSLDSKRKAGSILAVQAYIRLKLLTSMRRGDMLRLQMTQLKEDGIHITPGKTADSTGKSLIYEWTDELRAAVDMAKASRPVDLSHYLFCNRKGECYFNEETRPGRWMGFDVAWIRRPRFVRNRRQGTLHRA